MVNLSRQRGESKVGCVISIIVFLAAVIIAVKTVPVLVSMAELDSEITTLAERASISRYTNKVIVSRILQKAEDVDLPVSPDQIDIERHSKEITIHVEYDVDVRYPFYTYHWHKIHHVERTLF